MENTSTKSTESAVQRFKKGSLETIKFLKKTTIGEFIAGVRGCVDGALRTWVSMSPTIPECWKEHDRELDKKSWLDQEIFWIKYRIENAIEGAAGGYSDAAQDHRNGQPLRHIVKGTTPTTGELLFCRVMSLPPP